MPFRLGRLPQYLDVECTAGSSCQTARLLPRRQQAKS